MKQVESIALSLFARRIEAVCDEMGAHLRRAAFSPNIRDRLDYSCAVFNASGELCAQAAHIPVHLGSMAYAMGEIITQFDWQAGDQIILNDPFLGGTHLPDVTLIAPVYVENQLMGFVANRAHYADIGAASPGSMPLSRHLDDEGILIQPQKIQQHGRLLDDLVNSIVTATRNPVDALGDLQAQLACNKRGVTRLQSLIESFSKDTYRHHLEQLNNYAERLARASLSALPDGEYRFEDVMEDDGTGQDNLPITVTLSVKDSDVLVSFSGTAEQVAGNINCPLSVTAAGVWYAFRCLMPAQTPACAGCFRPITLFVPEGSLLNARRPAAVAAGNVETSTRVVDVVLGALAQAIPDQIPAASQGTMNNIAFGASGDQGWGYYETIGGGTGAGAQAPGLSATQSHMTNTRNTPIEVLEMRYPLRIRRYAIRRDSGGDGKHTGGDGLIREFEFTLPAHCTFLTERRRTAPWGLAGGQPGKPGRNEYNGNPVAAKCEIDLEQGDRVTVFTPGGGGWSKI